MLLKFWPKKMLSTCWWLMNFPQLTYKAQNAEELSDVVYFFSDNESRFLCRCFDILRLPWA